MASGHPDYTPHGTDQLYDRKVRDIAEKSLGWPSCQAISGAGCAACGSCKHFNMGKSPLHFAMRRPASQVEAAGHGNDGAAASAMASNASSPGTLPASRMPLKGGTYDPITALTLFNSHFFIAMVEGA